MIKFENTKVFNFEGAIRGMRNPMNSWDKSDSGFGCDYSKQHFCSVCEDGHTESCPNYFRQYKIGSNDMNLAKRLIKGGTEHRKFLRQIFISVDITAPLYWWKEFDTYKVGTVANSCSTMHKIHAKEFTLEDFSCEYLTGDIVLFSEKKYVGTGSALNIIVGVLNICRELYIQSKNKDYWYQMIQLLPESYNQKRTITMNYENVCSAHKQRTGHKLDEWHDFNKWAETELPYFKKFFLEE